MKINSSKKNDIIRTIKREILFTDSDYDKEVKQYLFKNMWYRRTIYNIGVKHILDLDERNKEIPDNEKHKREYFNRFRWSTEFHAKYEVEGMSLHEEFTQMVKGIRAMVAKDLDMANESVWKHRKEGIHSEVRFRRFNRNDRSFGVENKFRNSDKTRRALQINKDGLHLKFQCRGKMSIPYSINLTLKESVYSDRKYIFNELDVVEVHFKYKAGKFYIILPTKVAIIPRYDNEVREELAGIDEGERNSIALSDNGKEKKVQMIDIITPNIEVRYKRLSKRIDKLKSYRDNKIYGSNNMKKLSEKISRLYVRQSNIVQDRRKKVANIISSRYNNLIVDEFSVPIVNVYDKDICTKKRKNINKKMYMNGMSYFKEDLKIASQNNYTNYYKALPNTTRTCSRCGYINEPLPLSEEYLLCKHCGKLIHRDVNAALNCYDQYYEVSNYYYNILIT